MRKFLAIIRAYALPASAVPVLIGSVTAYKAGAFSWIYFALTMLAAFSVHSGANLANTYFDFKSGVDRRESSDDRTLVDGLLTPSGTLRLAIVFFLIAAVIGIYLSFKLGLPQLLALGAAGFLLAWFYTAGGVRYKYRAMGDLGIFLAFGPFIVIGTALIQTGRLLNEAFLASFPAGLLIAAISHANNMRDLESDRTSRIKTMAGMLGLNQARALYLALLSAAYVLACASGIWPAVFVAASLPAAIKLVSMSSKREFAPLVRKTAEFVAVFGLLFSTGIWIG